jgi:hypothetical protein
MYKEATDFGYVLDDKLVIKDNVFTKKGFGGINDILTKESFVGYFGERKDLVQGNRYRPLSIVTFAIEKGIIGEFKPEWSHLINIILYALSAILFMMCLGLMFKDNNRPWYFSIPFLAALIWLCHPTHVEAVANIKGRDEVMVMLFGMAALYTSMRYADTKKIGYFIGALVLFFLSCLSKENGLSLALIIPLTLYWFGEGNRKENSRLTIGLIAISILFLIIRTNIVGTFIGKESTDLMNNPFVGMTVLEKLGSKLFVLGKYLLLLVWPHPLSHDYYPYAIPKSSLFTLWPLVSLIVYLGLFYLAVRLWKIKSTYAYAILFFLLSIALMANIFVNVGTFMNERFLFCASAGFSVALSYFLVENLSQWTKNGLYVGTALAILISGIFAWRTIKRVPAWENNLTLNLSAVEACPMSARANSFMATSLFEEYKDKVPNAEGPKKVQYVFDLLSQTEDYANRAVKIIPDYLNANLMLVGVASERFKLEYDIKLYIRTMTPVILRRPDIPFIKDFSEYVNKTGNDGYLFPFYKHVGTELLKMNDNRKIWSAQYLAWAHQINPNDADVMFAMSKAYEAAGNQEEAKRWAQAAANSR